uniref:Uncharacterized protein n=1 Tax=Opuntia streptacantha TaxID=393608 RepID=A0A7C8ZF13_OPUST
MCLCICQQKQRLSQLHHSFALADKNKIRCYCWPYHRPSRNTRLQVILKIDQDGLIHEENGRKICDPNFWATGELANSSGKRQQRWRKHPCRQLRAQIRP